MRRLILLALVLTLFAGVIILVGELIGWVGAMVYWFQVCSAGVEALAGGDAWTG